MQAAEQQQGLPRRRDYTDELLKAFPGSQVVNPEGSVVDIPFQLPSGRVTALRISLPAHFPHERPVLCVLVPLQHRAVDPTGRLHVRGVDQWGARSSDHLLPQRGGIPAGVTPRDLVGVVREAFEVLLGEAAAKQGLLGESAATGSGGVDSADGSVGRKGRDGHVISLAGGMGGGQVVYGGGSSGPTDPAALLEGMPAAKLLQLLEDEEELKKVAGSWLKDTPAARALEDVRRQNCTAAEDNLALARSIEEARGHVAIVRSGEYAAMRALFEGLYSRQEAVVAKMGTAKLLARLREEADKSDAAADELLERFQEGSLPIEAFVEQYVAAREAFHITDLKRQAAEHSMLH
ncbi:hypothetical protein VOLCADRAFT_105049 [Volvox carteri f. nagariensis]|uniref:VPS37 C-terminal domain-containing protein n=1 Tax=Volvox carteri f. nagariensis TaxID=3068 RepID=D8TY19_VOLCA|nr:uncharacterized protein VOLCADRAFT_105049 [Volvox carteri f. nagariensis]EFJ47567.1 hypothetical protein VOLCADRAFT_105049 [Volvox carteri f. nagariensis]|eukprot:XP_002951391.1 hypothetical protein VOLCADRAFT_105049 [Volvox carteri f. nagariensis]